MVAFSDLCLVINSAHAFIIIIIKPLQPLIPPQLVWISFMSLNLSLLSACPTVDWDRGWNRKLQFLKGFLSLSLFHNMGYLSSKIRFYVYNKKQRSIRCRNQAGWDMRVDIKTQTENQGHVIRIVLCNNSMHLRWSNEGSRVVRSN